jgi:Plant organelle RNA recognition domain
MKHYLYLALLTFTPPIEICSYDTYPFRGFFSLCVGLIKGHSRYKIYTVVLREGYDGSNLVEKDPIVASKERLGELMQEGLHEYNQRRKIMNLEKKRKSGKIELRKTGLEESDDVTALGPIKRREERERFYKVLFDDR